MAQVNLNSMQLPLERRDMIWDDIVADESLTWGSAACNLYLDFRDDGRKSHLYLAKHPSSGWYLEYNSPTFLTLVSHSNNNDSGWAQAFMNPETVHEVDAEGNVWVLLGLNGEPGRILQRCFADEELASHIVRQFVAGAEIPSDAGLVDVSAIKPYPMWEEWNYQAEIKS